MEPSLLAFIVFIAVLVMLVARVPIAYSLGSAAAGGLLIFFSWQPGMNFDLEAGLRPTLSILASTPFDFIHNYPLSMIPLFIGLGHVAFHAGITTDLYYALRVWFGRLPGGLAMASVLGCGGFSAITGSSVACASAMGRIAVPEMLRYGYARTLATGAVAAGGTLGSLIPPSLLFVIYAMFTEQSVKDLFLAGILPGAISLVGYLVTISVWSTRRPDDAPKLQETPGWKEKVAALEMTWPAASLLIVIIGGIYLGFFTPTEAAAVSLVMAVVIGFARQRLNWAGLVEALHETVLQSSMILMISIGAKIFVSFVSLTRIAPALLEMLQDSGASPFLVLLGIAVLYLVLGMFLDSIGILVLTLPFTVPVIEGYGMNLIWFGVVVIKLLEIGLITPPIGLNVFVIKSVSPKSVSLEDVFKGVSWFLILDAVVLAAILLFPIISLLIPMSVN